MNKNPRVIGVFAHSDVGKHRRENEDSYALHSKLGLWIIADGMGGHDFGRQASEMACQVIVDRYQSGCDIEEAILGAHDAILHRSQENNVSLGMGSTVVVLQQHEAGLYVLWVGDSRAYLHANSDLKRLTTDHSVVQQLLDNNLISYEESRTHPKRHLVTRSLGMKSSADPLQIGRCLVPKVNGRYELLLCSDGLTNELSDPEIQAVLGLNLGLKERLERLAQRANEAGGHDNITAILLTFAED